MSSDYDDWLATTPEDEEEAAQEREAKRDAAAQRKLDAAMFGYDDPRTDGWVEADFVYDPLSKKGFE